MEDDDCYFPLYSSVSLLVRSACRLKEQNKSTNNIRFFQTSIFVQATFQLHVLLRGQFLVPVRA